MENQMNILLQSNEKYAKYMSVMLVSLFSNHKDTKINIYVIHSSLSEETMNNLKQFVTKYNNSIEFIKCSSDLFKGFKTNSYLTIEMYYKLLAHIVLPKNIDRVLFLDIDLIIDENIYDFYSADFEGKYIIAAGQAPFSDYSNLDKNFNVMYATKGKYFNVGVLVLNLQKFRADNIVIEDYYRAVKEISAINSKFLYEQGIMNYMFAQYGTKYYQVLEYNYRFHIQYENQKLIDGKKIKFKPKIIHYANTLIQYKPWDLNFTDEELCKFDLGEIIPGYFNYNKEIHELNKIWWNYAEKIDKKFYDIIKSESEAKKDFYLCYMFNNIKKMRNQIKDLNYHWHSHKLKNLEFNFEIEKLQSQYNCNFLEALGILYRTYYKTDYNLQFYNNLNNYFNYLYTHEDEIVICFAVGDDASKQWHRLEFLNDWKIKTDLRNKFRYSFVCIIDKSNDVVLEKSGKEPSSLEYVIPETGEKFEVHSMGFDGKYFYADCILKETPNAKEGVNYCLSKRGLNICIYNKKTKCIVDIVNSDLHKDANLELVRKM